MEKLHDQTSYMVELNYIKHFLETRVYPYNPELAEEWMKSPNNDFGGMSPTEIISKRGMDGILCVKDYLSYQGK